MSDKNSNHSNNKFLNFHIIVHINVQEVSNECSQTFMDIQKLCS